MKFLKEEVTAMISYNCNLIIDCTKWDLKQLKVFVQEAKKKNTHLTLTNLNRRPQEAIALASDPHGRITIEI